MIASLNLAKVAGFAAATGSDGAAAESKTSGAEVSQSFTAVMQTATRQSGNGSPRKAAGQDDQKDKTELRADSDIGAALVVLPVVVQTVLPQMQAEAPEGAELLPADAVTKTEGTQVQSTTPQANESVPVSSATGDALSVPGDALPSNVTATDRADEGKIESEEQTQIPLNGTTANVPPKDQMQPPIDAASATADDPSAPGAAAAVSAAPSSKSADTPAVNQPDAGAPAVSSTVVAGVPDGMAAVMTATFTPLNALVMPAAAMRSTDRMPMPTMKTVTTVRGSDPSGNASVQLKPPSAEPVVTADADAAKQTRVQHVAEGDASSGTAVHGASHESQSAAADTQSAMQGQTADASTLHGAGAANLMSAHVPDTSSAAAAIPAAQNSALAHAAAGSASETGSPSQAGFSAVNTAHLIQRAGQTEMRVGMQSDEFGAISIRTSVSKDALSAQIAVSHTELARVLAEHVPEMQVRMGAEQPLSVKIAGPSSSQFMAGQDGAKSGGEHGAQRERDAAPHANLSAGEGSRGITEVPAVVAGMIPANYGRLDIRI